MGCYSNDTILTGIGTKGDPVGYRTVEIKNAIYENRLTPTLKSRKNKFFLLGLLARSIKTLLILLVDSSAVVLKFTHNTAIL